MCQYSKLIINPKYTENKKDGGIIPTPSDKRVLVVPIGCGKCEECRRKKANEWMIRLDNEYRNIKNERCRFITLTFNKESLKKYTELAIEEIKRKKETHYGIDIRNIACKIAIRRWLERIRKDTGKSIKHWIITELGGGHSKRIHMHGFIWTDNIDTLEKWTNGYTYEGDYMSPKAITYTTKYMMKINKREPMYMPKIMTSKGIGSEWINTVDARRAKYIPNGTLEEYVDQQGNKRGLPIYYRNKLYTEDEKEKLWIEKLDKGERWVGRVCIKRKNFKSDEEFENECIRMMEENRRESMTIGNIKMNWWEIQKYKAELIQLSRNENKEYTKTTKSKKESIDMQWENQKYEDIQNNYTNRWAGNEMAFMTEKNG